MTIDEVRDKLKGKFTIEVSIYGDSEMAEIHALTLALLDEHERFGKIVPDLGVGAYEVSANELDRTAEANAAVEKILEAL